LFLLVPAPRPNCEPKFDVFRASDPILLDSPSPLRREAWRRLLSSYPGNLPLLLDGILTFGARLGYEGPEQFILSRNLPVELSDHDVLDKKAAADLAAGLISPIIPEHPCIVSPLGVVPKGDGGRRRIHHLSYPEGESVNDFIPAEYASITYATFDAIVADVLQAGRGCTIIKRDIRDAFRMVPVAANDRWLLGFGWKGVFYTERALPFGLCTAPFLFNLFAEGLHWILLSRGWRRLHHYLDDFISIFSAVEVTAGHAAWATNDWIQATNDLGVPRKDSKDEFGTTVPVFGIEVDTLAMEARLPREKMDKLRHMVSKPLQSGRTNRKEMESLAGLMSFCSRVVRLGRTFSQSSYDFIADAARNCRSGTMPVPPRLHADMSWWHDLLHEFNGVRLIDDITRPAASLYTDACDDGLGGFLLKNGGADTPSPDFAFSCRPNPRLRAKHINVKETAAVAHALKRWGTVLQGHALCIYTDSSTVVSGILRGSLHGPPMAQLRRLLLEAAKFDITLRCEWIPGQENRLADALSRADEPYIANHYPTLLQILPSAKRQRPSSIPPCRATPLPPPCCGTA